MAGGSFDRDRLIRHNLERFLEPSGKSLSLWQAIYGIAPLVPLAMAFICGICVQYIGGLSPWPAVLLAGVAVVLFFLTFLFSCANQSRIVVGSISVVLLFFAGGMLRYAAFDTPGPDHLIRLVGQQRRLATLEGVILSQVYHDQRSDWAFARYFPTPPQSSFYLSLHAVQTPDGLIAASGTVRVQVGQIAEHLNAGDRVRLYCWLGPFSGAANPGQFDMRVSMHRRGVLLGASVVAADGVEILAHRQDGPMARLRERLTAYADGALFEEADYPDRSAALATALLLGQRSDLDPATYAAFQRTGLAHFISLSGMHVGILAGSLWAVSRFLGLPKPLRAVFCLVLLLGYGLVVPPRPPTVRAIFLACFFLTSVLFNRRIRPLNTLALSAMVLLAARPADVFSASWQLSFSTVLGILVLYDPICKRLLSWTVFKVVEVADTHVLERSAVQAALQGLYHMMRLLAVGLAAWLGGAGFLLYHFNSITPLASVWTVLAMPWVLGVLYAGYIKVALAPFFPTLSLVCAIVLDYCCRGLAYTVSVFAQLSWSEVLVGAVPIWAVAVGYLALYLIRFAPRPVTGRICLIAVLIFAAAGWKHARNDRDTLTMTCLSVGHGQAINVSFPDRTAWLIDAGSITHKDPGTRTVLPYLRYRGIGSLDAIVLTHGDMDHFNGLPEVVARMPSAAVFANASVFEKAQQSSSVSYLKQHLRQTHNALRPIEDLAALPGGVTVRMLWPDAETAQDSSLSDNDRSQVVWIEYAGRSLLLCGDVEPYAQNAIMRRWPTLKADVVVLPHHGSMTTLDKQFVAAFEPSVVIASCAAGRLGNAFVPTADSAVEAFYTPVDGAVTVTIKADGTLCAVGFKSQKTVHLN